MLQIYRYVGSFMLCWYVFQTWDSEIKVLRMGMEPLEKYHEHRMALLRGNPRIFRTSVWVSLLLRLSLVWFIYMSLAWS